MEITNLIKKNIKTTVQGIDVLITTEYNQGEIPCVYNCNVSGQVKPIHEGKPEKWFNINCTLDIEEKVVQINTSGDVPIGFLAALETEILAANELLIVA